MPRQVLRPHLDISEIRFAVPWFLDVADGQGMGFIGMKSEM